MIKEAEISDAPAIYSLVSRYSGPIKGWTKKETENFISNHRDYYVLAAKQNGEVIGYAFTRLTWKKMHVINIAVKNEMRGQGIAKEMMRRLINSAKSQGLSHVYLEVRASNTTAVKMYQNLSFKTKYIVPGLYQNEDGFIMYLPLSQNHPSRRREIY